MPNNPDTILDNEHPKMSDFLTSLREKERMEFTNALTKFLDVCSSSETHLDLINAHSDFLAVVACMSLHTPRSAFNATIEDARKTGFREGYVKRNNEKPANL